MAGCGAGVSTTTELEAGSTTTTEPVTASTEAPATTTSIGQGSDSASDWLSDYGRQFEQALDEAETIITQLRGEPTQTECQGLQESWDPMDQEMNDLIDLMPGEMATLGDALYVALGDVSIALSFCSAGETGAALQQQLDFYDLDRRVVSDVAETFGWDL